MTAEDFVSESCGLIFIAALFSIFMQEIRDRILAEESSSPASLEQRRAAAAYEQRGKNLMLSRKSGIPAKQITLPVSVSVSARKIPYCTAENLEEVF